MLTNKTYFPTEKGFSMPAEWELHTATWTSWPFSDDLWGGQLEGVRIELTDLVRTISAFEPVHLNVCHQEAEEDARKRLGTNSRVVYHRIPLDDIWFRDNGPIFIQQGENVSFVRWEFNSWGKKFNWQKDNRAPFQIAPFLKMDYFEAKIVLEGGSIDVNGTGVALTTRQCLLHPERNPDLTQKDLERYLNNYLGIQKVLWLESGLEGDHTDGHIDTIVRFVSDRTIVCSICTDPADPNTLTTQKNLKDLKSFTDCAGNSFEIVPLVLPKNVLKLDGMRLPASYANFYIGNGFVVVPQYGDPLDSEALSILRSLFPTHEVIGLSSKHLICGGGSFHCVTQQQPLGKAWKK